MGQFVFEEEIPCVFGHNHTIKVTMTEKHEVLNVVSSCDAEAEETRGLWKLGTDPLTTCLGIKEQFIAHVKSGETLRDYDLPEQYRKHTLFRMGKMGAQRVREIRNEREELRKKEEARLREEAMNDHVTRRLNCILQERPERQLKAFGVTKNSQGMYVLGSMSQYNHWDRQPQQLFPVGLRAKGKWYVDRNFREHGNWYNIISKWGGECPVCEGQGYSHHSQSKGHKAKMEKWLMIALQMTSSEGHKLLQENPDHEFKYRKNMKNIIGVEFV